MPEARSVAQALAASPAAALIRRAADSQRIARALAAAGASLPFDPLAPGACELRERTLWLTAKSPALAAKLRQCLPQLLASLDRQGFELTEIRVRLQPTQKSYRMHGSREFADDDLTRSREPPTGPEPNAKAALGLAEKLALTFPHSPVGEAARRLAGRLRKRLA
ncbi:MAG TPA: hypothetical protein VNK91_04625 [Burkholderiaceae bacterium]|jgi:hypothetical protein|nr:hypothetical protein [Burkholderiaceae bacterium]